VGVDDLLLPGFEGDLAVVLLAGAVLGEKAREVLEVHLDVVGAHRRYRHVALWGKTARRARSALSWMPGQASSSVIMRLGTLCFA